MPNLVLEDYLDNRFDDVFIWFWLHALTVVLAFTLVELTWNFCEWWLSDRNSGEDGDPVTEESSTDAESSYDDDLDYIYESCDSSVLHLQVKRDDSSQSNVLSKKLIHTFVAEIVSFLMVEKLTLPDLVYFNQFGHVYFFYRSTLKYQPLKIPGFDLLNLCFSSCRSGIRVIYTDRSTLRDDRKLCQRVWNAIYLAEYDAKQILINGDSNSTEKYFKSKQLFCEDLIDDDALVVNDSETLERWNNDYTDGEKYGYVSKVSLGGRLQVYDVRCSATVCNPEDFEYLLMGSDLDTEDYAEMIPGTTDSSLSLESDSQQSVSDESSQVIKFRQIPELLRNHFQLSSTTGQEKIICDMQYPSSEEDYATEE